MQLSNAGYFQKKYSFLIKINLFYIFLTISQKCLNIWTFFCQDIFARPLLISGTRRSLCLPFHIVSGCIGMIVRTRLGLCPYPLVVGTRLGLCPYPLVVGTRLGLCPPFRSFRSNSCQFGLGFFRQKPGFCENLSSSSIPLVYWPRHSLKAQVFGQQTRLLHVASASSDKKNPNQLSLGRSN
jgi:hypothetical protein